MYQGWIKLDRKLLEHWVWQKKPFSQGQAWVDLLLLVNHKAEKVQFDGKTTTVKPGSRITSIRQLSERWGWSKDKTVRFLNSLESDGMIKKSSDSKRTVLAIVNYGVLQGQASTKKTAVGRRPDTGETPAGTNKNDKNDKNDKKGGGAAGSPSGDDEREKLIAELRR